MTDIATPDHVIAADLESGSARKKLHPGFKKNLVIIGGIFGIAVIATVAVFAFITSKDDIHAQSTMTLPPAGERKNDGANPQYTKLLDEKNVVDHKNAAKTGGTFIPVIPDKPVDVKVDTPGSAKETGGHAKSNGNAEPNAQSGEGEMAGRAAAKFDTTSFADAMKQLVAQWRPKPPEQIAVASSEPSPQRDGNATQGLTAMTPSAGQSLAPNGVVAPTTPTVVKPVNYGNNLLKPFAATLDKPIRTDIDPRTIVTMRSGPYTGAQLVGNATRLLQNVKIEFGDMYWNGKHYTIKAIALDEATLSEAVSGDYDRELMARHFLPLTFDTLGGFVTAESQVGSQVVATAGGAVQSTPAPNTRQAIASGLSAGLKDAAAIAAEDMPQQHVSKPFESTVAIMFLE